MTGRSRKPPEPGQRRPLRAPSKYRETRVATVGTGGAPPGVQKAVAFFSKVFNAEREEVRRVTDRLFAVLSEEQEAITKATFAAGESAQRAGIRGKLVCDLAAAITGATGVKDYSVEGAIALGTIASAVVASLEQAEENNPADPPPTPAAKA